MRLPAPCTKTTFSKLNLILTKALTIGAQNNKQNIDSEIILAAVNDMGLSL